MVSRSSLAGLQANMAALQRAQERTTSGLQIQSASEDPSRASKIMTAGSSLRALEQYRTNVGRAASRVDAEDAVVTQINDLMIRAKTIGTTQATATVTPESRRAALAEVKQIFDQMVTLGNTKFGQEYLFGGEQSTTAPFAVTGSGATLDFSSTTPTGVRNIAIGESQTLAIGHDGTQLLVSTGVLASVRDLALSLDQASPTYGMAGIASAMTSLDSSFDTIQTIVGDVGAQANRLETTQQNLDAFKMNLTTFKSDLEDVDIETAVTELTNRQVAYQAAMLATSKVIGLSLTDYLR